MKESKLEKNETLLYVASNPVLLIQVIIISNFQFLLQKPEKSSLSAKDAHKSESCFFLLETVRLKQPI